MITADDKDENKKSALKHGKYVAILHYFTVTIFSMSFIVSFGVT